MKYVKIDALKKDMVLASPIYDNNGFTLLNANVHLSNFLISKIEDHKYPGVYIYDDSEMTFMETLISEKTRIQAIKSLKENKIDACLFIANQMVQEIKDNDKLTLEVMQLSSYDNYTFVHSINVTTTSIIIGIGMGLTEEELKNLSQAALLHDIGKSLVSKDILNKPGKLTDEEYTEMKRHSEHGYNILKENLDVSSTTRNAVYSHHENEDGTGYPRGLTSDKIHKFAKIIHVADVYDALTAKRSYKDEINPADAIEFLMANIGSIFDPNVVNTFIQHIAPYPLGMSVLLSDGRMAHVEKNNAILSRPVVMTDNGEIINLMNVLNITILKMIKV